MTPLAIAAAVTVFTVTAALAADIDTESTLSVAVGAPTAVGIGSNTFTIEVWATGNYNPNNNSTGIVKIVDTYNMSTTGTITPDATQTTDLTFPAGHYDQAYCLVSSPPVGCAANPHGVSATLIVASGTPSGTTGTLTVSMDDSPGLEEDVLAVGYVVVSVLNGCDEPAAPAIVAQHLMKDHGLSAKQPLFKSAVQGAASETGNGIFGNDPCLNDYAAQVGTWLHANFTH